MFCSCLNWEVVRTLVLLFLGALGAMQEWLGEGRGHILLVEVSTKREVRYRLCDERVAVRGCHWLVRWVVCKGCRGDGVARL